MKLIKLTSDYELKPFNCDDTDLNNFLAEDAKNFINKRIGNTFLLMDNDHIAAYFCYSTIKSHA